MLNKSVFENLDTSVAPVSASASAAASVASVTTGNRLVVDSNGETDWLYHWTLRDILFGGDKLTTVNLTPGEYVMTMPGFGCSLTSDPILLIVGDHSVQVSGLGLNKVRKEDSFGDHPYFETKQFAAECNMLGIKGITFQCNPDVKIVTLNDYEGDYYIHTLDTPYDYECQAYKDICKFIFNEYYDYLECEHAEIEHIFEFIDYVAWYEHGPANDSRYSWDLVSNRVYIAEYIG